MLNRLNRATSRSFILLIAFALVGWVLGAVDGHLPSSGRVGDFWVGNLSSTWILLPFLAGYMQRSRPWAVATGILTVIAFNDGFYLQLLHGFVSRTVFGFVIPTELIEDIVAGALYGAAGHWWGRSRSVIAGSLLALPFLAEPWIWPLYIGYQGPLLLWVVETAVGLGLLASAMVIWRQRRNSAPL